MLTAKLLIGRKHETYAILGILNLLAWRWDPMGLPVLSGNLR